MTDLYCPVRKCRCKPLPEEAVRIGLLTHMIGSLGYPAHSLAVEKELRHLPHLSQGLPIPPRRADILCFAKGIHPEIDLYPLLMIECKAVRITSEVIGQVAGYNHYVQAYFIAVANQEEVRVGWRNSCGGYDFVPYLPPYEGLLGSLQEG